MTYLVCLLCLLTLVTAVRFNVPTGPIANSATILETTTFPSFNGTLPFIQGSIRSILFDEEDDTVYATTTSHLIVIDGDLSTVSDYQVFEIPEVYVYNIELMILDKVNERVIFFGTPGGLSRIAFFEIDTLRPAENAIAFPALSGDIIESFRVSETVFYVVSSETVVRFEITGPGSLDSTVFIDTELDILSASIDYSSRMIYMGLANATVLPLNITSDNLAEANTLPVINLAIADEEATSVTVLEVDERAGNHYLYVGTAGNAEVPASLSRVNLDTRVPDADYWLFSALDFGLVESILNEDGTILYLLQQRSPARMIQFDTANWKWEETFVADFDSANDISVGIYVRDYLYIGGSSAGSFEIQISVFEAADPCLSNCFDNGLCENRVCTCDTYVSALGNLLEFQQPWCETRNCDLNCNDNAVACVDGNCTCFANFTGDLCDQQRCPNDCISEEFGTCDETTYECNCNPGFDGDDCSLTIDLPCPLYTELGCAVCTDAVACGWCASTQTCEYGNPITPFDIPNCPNWNYGGCPGGFFVAAIILLTVMGLLMLVNFFSYIKLYTSEEEAPVRHEWYSLQRANKWWVAAHQLQLMGATLFIGYGLPTSMTTFLTYFSWTNFAIPATIFFDERLPANSSNFNTVEYPAALFLGWAGIDFENLALSVIIVWAIAAVGLTVLFTIILLILTAVRGGEIGLMITTRPIYVFLRMLDFGVFPFALFGGLSLGYMSEAGISGVIGIVMIAVAAVYLIGVLLFFVLAQVQENIKGLFQPGSKGRCLYVYGHLKKDTLAFAFFGILKRLLLGLLIGLFYGAAAGQIISVIAVHIIWIVVYWVTDLHADLYQKACETGVGICNIFAFAFLFGFAGSSDGVLGDGTVSIIMTILYIIAMSISIGVCLVFYFFNWFQKEENFSISQVINVILCKD